MTEQTARVFIWYGHPLFAQAMKTLLRREGMEIVGIGSAACEVLPAILRLQPDVVVADRIVERMYPLGIAEVMRGCGRVRVLVFDLIEDGMRIYDGQRSGAGKLEAIVQAIAGGVLSPAPAA